MTNYKIAQNGVFEDYQDGIGLFHGTLKRDFPLPFTQEDDTFEVVATNLEEELRIDFDRMPLNIFQQMLAFAKAVWKKQQTEVIIFHKYIEKKWYNSVPYQWVSRTSICYHPELDTSGASMVVSDTHLHPPTKREDGAETGTSYHSTTDGLDERKNDGIFVVVTGFSPFTCDPDIVCMVRGKKFHLKPEQFLDMSQYDPNPTFPEEWMERVNQVSGNYDCKGCKAQKAKAEAAAKKSSALEAYEEEKKVRIIPIQVIEKWKEANKDEQLPGDAFMETMKKWREKAPANNKLFRCDNHGCMKNVGMPKCDECGKGILSDAVVKAVAQALNEVHLFDHDLDSMPKYHDAVIKGIEEAEGITIEDPTKASPTPAPTPTAVSGSPGDERHIIIVATEKPEMKKCEESCPYKNVAHQHVGSKDELKRLFKDVTEGRERTDCKSQGGRCLYPDTGACAEFCCWDLDKVGEAMKSPNRFEDKVCINTGCIGAGHTWYGCDVRKAKEEASIGCPSKTCETGGHLWPTCPVRVGLKRAEEIKIQESKKDDLNDETKQFPICIDAGCKSSKHVRSTCAIRQMVVNELIPKIAEFCTDVGCRDAKHMYSVCKFAKEVDRLVGEYTKITDNIPVILGSKECHDKCDMKGKVHTHELTSEQKDEEAKAKAPTSTSTTPPGTGSSPPVGCDDEWAGYMG